MTDDHALEVTNPSLPIPLDELEADTKAGGKITAGDIAVPYLEILQGLSPQVQPASPKFIRGAMVSDLFLTVVDERYPGDIGLDIIPCYYERVINEWVPREKGGGLVTTHNPENNILSKAKVLDPSKPADLYLANGNLVIDTAYHYVLTKRPDKGWTQTIFPLKSTMLKHSRKWNSNITTMVIPGTSKVAPRWLYEWRLMAIAETKKDRIWYVPAWKLGNMVDREIYQMAKDYAKIASTGMLRRPMEELPTPEEDDANSPI